MLVLIMLQIITGSVFNLLMPLQFAARVAKHQLWMTRMVAAAVAFATQRLVVIPGVVFFGERWLTDSTIALLLCGGLLLNLAVAELILVRARSLTLERGVPWRGSRAEPYRLLYSLANIE